MSTRTNRALIEHFNLQRPMAEDRWCLLRRRQSLEHRFQISDQFSQERGSSFAFARKWHLEIDAIAASAAAKTSAATYGTNCADEGAMEDLVSAEKSPVCVTTLAGAWFSEDFMPPGTRSAALSFLHIDSESSTLFDAVKNPLFLHGMGEKSPRACLNEDSEDKLASSFDCNCLVADTPSCFLTAQENYLDLVIQEVIPPHAPWHSDYGHSISQRLLALLRQSGEMGAETHSSKNLVHVLGMILPTALVLGYLYCRHVPIPPPLLYPRTLVVSLSLTHFLEGEAESAC